MILKNVKKTMDYLPEEQIVRNKVINTLSNIFGSKFYNDR